MKLKELLLIVLDHLGYQNVREMLTSIFSWHIKYVYVFGASLSSLITLLHGITDSYLYTPAMGLYILWVVSLFDIALGASKAIEERRLDPEKPGFSANKFGRSMFRVLVQTMFIVLFFQMSQTWNYLIASWMVDSLLIIFTASTFYSGLKNAFFLGLVTKDQYDFIESIINVKKLFKRTRK